MLHRRSVLALAAVAFAGFPARAEAKEWFYAAGGRALGPETLTAIRELAGKGFIRADTQVYVAASGWRPARDHPELADLFVAAERQGAGDAPADQATLEAYVLGTWKDVGIWRGGLVILDAREVTFAAGGKLSGDGIDPGGDKRVFTGNWTVSPGGKDQLVLEETILIDGVDRSTRERVLYTILTRNRMADLSSDRMRDRVR